MMRSASVHDDSRFITITITRSVKVAAHCDNWYTVDSMIEASAGGVIAVRL